MEVPAGSSSSLCSAPYANTFFTCRFSWLFPRISLPAPGSCLDVVLAVLAVSYLPYTRTLPEDFPLHVHCLLAGSPPTSRAFSAQPWVSLMVTEELSQASTSTLSPSPPLLFMALVPVPVHLCLVLRLLEYFHWLGFRASVSVVASRT